MSLHTATCMLLLCVVAPWPARAAEKRPNFLFILTDDQAPDTLSAYGNEVCRTPSIDRLAAEGMVFQDAHHMGSWVGAVCRPSRTMIMTGRTVWNIPKGRKRARKGGERKAERRKRKQQKPEAGGGADDPAARQSLPAIFNRAGYDTFRTCKRGNSYEAANRLFAVSKVATSRQAIAARGSGWHGDQVVEHLEQRRASRDDDPFLIYLGFSHPHDPRNATPELAAKYGATNKNDLAEPNPKAPPLPINYLPEHPFHHGHPGLRDEEKVEGVKMRRDEATVRNEIGREYACIENIDRQVGRVLKKLQAMGELENTYVFFAADHGIAVGRHGLMGKQNLYEHSWRVPFIARGPGIEPGSRVSGYIYLLDLLPTLCDLAGISAPDVVEGRSFRPVLEGRVERVRDVLYGVYCGGTKPGMRAIKTNGWKLIEYDMLDGKVRETQLFHLDKNPHELLAEHHDEQLRSLLKSEPRAEQIDLAEVPEYTAKRRELQKLLRSEMKRLGDPHELR